MKTLQSRVRVLYRFRCETCRSKFEMTEEEKLENDWEFDDRKPEIKQEERESGRRPNNWLNRFYCPICNCKSYARGDDMHRYSVMDNGIEITDY